MTRRTTSTLRHLRPESLTGLRWRGLVRESTERQADGWSPDRQREDLRRASIELGMIPAEPLFYERVGSGEAEAVPELARALADGKAGQFDVLVVLTTSRFARNRAEAVRMKAEFRKAGLIVYFVAQRIISGTYAGGLTEGIHEVIDEAENETRRFWIAGGQRQRQMAGQWTGRIPYGYRMVMADRPDGSRGWDGQLEPDPTEAPIVRRMYDMALVGQGVRAIAYALNADGLRTNDGTLWLPDRVRTMLRNPVYAGHLVRYHRPRDDRYYERESEDGYADFGAHVPAIVSSRVFEDANQALSQRFKNPASPTRHRSYPLTGVLRCGECGRAMTGAFRRTRYYRCVGRAIHKACQAPSIAADVAEGAFARWLDSLTLPSDWREAIARTNLDSSRAGEKDRRATIEARIARLRNLYSWGDIGEDEYRAEAASLKEQLGLVAMPSIGSIEAVAHALEQLGSAWLTAPAHLQAAVPPLLLRAIEVRGARFSALEVRGEVRALLDLCVPTAPAPWPVRFVA